MCVCVSVCLRKSGHAPAFTTAPQTIKCGRSARARIEIGVREDARIEVEMYVTGLFVHAPRTDRAY